MRLFIQVVVALVALTGLQAFSLREVDEEDSDNFKLTREEVLKNHPDLVKWFERATERLKSGRNATEEDLNEVRMLLKGVRQQIYDFVTSPMYPLVTNMLIEKSLMKTRPVLGVMPLKEVREFYDIVKRDPQLMELLLDEEEKIVDVMPGGQQLAEWFTNSTSHIISESFNETSH